MRSCAAKGRSFGIGRHTLCYGQFLLDKSYMSRIAHSNVSDRNASAQPSTWPTLDGGRDYIWEPKRPYTGRKRLSRTEKAHLYAVLASCDRLWVDAKGAPVHTNLFKQFGIPSDRATLRTMAEAPKK